MGRRRHARLRVDALSVEDARAVNENVRKYLKVRMHRHWFPDVALSRAAEADYEQVMNAVVEEHGRA